MGFVNKTTETQVKCQNIDKIIKKKYNYQIIMV